MNDQSTNKPPVWFWIVAALALVWNLFGVMAYLGSVYMPPEALEAMDPDRRTFIENTPGWATGAFAIAVFAGSIGCLLLLFKRKLAIPFLGASLGGILVQQYYGFVASNAVEVYGTSEGLVLPLMVLAIGVLLIILARSATRKGWIS